MLTIYRPHLVSCDHCVYSAKKYSGPAWVKGTHRSEYFRRVFNLRNCKTAQNLVRDLDAGIARKEELRVSKA